MLYAFCVASLERWWVRPIPSRVAAMQPWRWAAFAGLLIVGASFSQIDNIPPQIRWNTNPV